MNSEEQAPEVQTPEERAWFEDYAAGCSEMAHLYAVAFERIVVELDEPTALALAPTILKSVVATGQENAQQGLQQRQQLRELWEREQQLARQAQLARPQEREQNPW